METINEEYKILEDKYIEARDKGDKRNADLYLNKMYKLIKGLVTNYINRYCMRKGIKYLKDREDKIHDAAMFVIMRYLKKPSFRVEKISSYAHFGKLKSLFENMSKEMNEVSYEEYFEEKKNTAN
jgi:hypothetical protein